MRIVEKGRISNPTPPDYRKEAEIMPASKAQQKAVNKYMAANYDRINLTVPKGKREEIKEFADCQGESVNGFINRAIDSAMGRNTEKPAVSPQNAAESHRSSSAILTPDALKIAQEAAQRAGEGIPEFVSRAVTNQNQRDKMALLLSGTTGKKDAQN